ncbi:hypothetical protein [Nocardia brasiliensis ATCC 700358] [Mycobacterium shimoidei]|uniref:DUF222 domain-containing protein n=1 Tax=Mycobacterium shimoidei TaxID=29313 RepID=A0A375YYX0_MYCSH|nr:hypothetical protein [Nocardia brasiliensis ATCC 700358] [Mycobacterium shimoidei]
MLADRLTDCLNPDGDFTDTDRARRRGLVLGRQDGEGMSKISGYLTPQARATVEAVFAKLAAPGMCNPDDQTPCVDAAPPQTAVAADTRSTAQRPIHDARVVDDVAAKLAAQSYWHRKERALDSIKDTPKTIQAVRDLISTADDTQVAVLAEELGDYLASRSMPTDWLPDALAAKLPGLADSQADRMSRSDSVTFCLRAIKSSRMQWKPTPPRRRCLIQPMSRVSRIRADNSD